MKKLINTPVWKNPSKYISIDWKYFYVFLQRIWRNLLEKSKCHKQTAYKCKQIPDGKLSRFVEMKFNFPM